ncbi:serine hydrolase domain-containing protein [Staphylococcus aureus]
MTTKKLKQIIIFLICTLVLIAIMIGYRFYQNNEQNFNAKQTYNQNKKTLQSNQINKLTTVMDKNDKKISEINNYLEKVKFNGTAAIFEKGQLKLNKGFGVKNYETGEKNKADTLYLIGSAQKFTTGLILKQLVNEHKINMNDSITQYLPWFKTSKPVTLNQLMLHQSGLYKYKASTHYKSLDEAVKAIQHKGIEVEFYNQNRYNDANYLVLSRMIEEVTGKSYEMNFKEKLVKPYQLKNTAFFNDETFHQVMAEGYKIGEDENHPVKQSPNVLDQYYGAGNLYMTPYDMGELISSLQYNKLFEQSITMSLLHESKTFRYPIPYRYGFYSLPDKNRINGGFFGQVFTAYFNDNYIVVLGTNYENSSINNEKKMKHIYYNLLNQGGPYNIVGQRY